MNLRILFVPTLCALFFCSCSSKKTTDETTTAKMPVNEYTLTVTNIPLADDTKVYLMDIDAMKNRGVDPEAFVDTATVKNNRAVFSNSLDVPMVMFVCDESAMHPNYFLLENGDITYDFENDEAISPINNLLAEYNDSISAKQAELIYALPPQDDEHYEEACEEAEKQMKMLLNDYMEKGVGNSFGYYLFFTTGPSMDVDEFKACVENFPGLLSTKKGAQFKALFDAKEATAAGKKYVDYEVEYNGVTTKLSDYVKPGQYTLVDYWASWCGPCKRAIESELKPIYAEYGPRGLEIVGVAVWEDAQQTEDWLKENELPWNIILNAQSIPTHIYGITGIPCIMLIGPDGTIVARDLFGDEISEAVKAAFAE